MLISNMPKAYFDRFLPRQKDGASSAVLRNNFLALASCDFEPLRAVCNLVLETHNFGSDISASETYSGTGVTITRDAVNQRDGVACLKAVIDATGNRQILRTTLTSALDLSSFVRKGIWHRCTKISSAIKFILRDGSGNESYWNFTTYGTADTWAQSNIVLASPDSNNGTPAVLTDIVSYGFKALEANETYLFNILYCHIWAMKVYIQQSYVANYFYPVVNGIIKVKFDGGFSPTISAPSASPRIDLISISGSNVITVTPGAEVASPDYDDIPATPIGHLPLYAIYIPLGATYIVEYHLKDDHPGQAYIYADLRPTIGQNSNLGIPIVTAGGSADAITADYAPDVTLANLTLVAFVAAYANATATPTFSPDGLTAHTIVKKGGQALVAGDIPAAGAVCIVEYNLANTRWELLNPAVAGSSGTSGTFVNGDLSTGKLTVTHSLGLSAPYTRIVVVVDNNNKVIDCPITFATNSFEIDLSLAGAISGTWGYRYI